MPGSNPAKMWKTNLGTNKVLFDTELYVIREILSIALRNGRTC